MESVKDSVQIPVDITGRYAHRIIYAIQPLKSSIFISHDGRTINAKSILGILSLQLKHKDIVDINCYGENSKQIEEDLEFVSKFITNIENN